MSAFAATYCYECEQAVTPTEDRACPKCGQRWNLTVVRLDGDHEHKSFHGVSWGCPKCGLAWTKNARTAP